VTRRLAALLTVAAFAGAACGGEGGRPTAAAPVPPSAPVDVPPGYEARTVPAEWRLERVEEDDRTLVVRVATGSCLRFDHLTMESRDSERIVLEAWNEEWVPVAEGAGCDDDQRFDTHRVSLPERVDGRTIAGGRPGLFSSGHALPGSFVS
jgi:hypothetical protein